MDKKLRREDLTYPDPDSLTTGLDDSSNSGDSNTSPTDQQQDILQNFPYLKPSIAITADPLKQFVVGQQALQGLVLPNIGSLNTNLSQIQSEMIHDSVIQDEQFHVSLDSTATIVDGLPVITSTSLHTDAIKTEQLQSGEHEHNFDISDPVTSVIEISPPLYQLAGIQAIFSLNNNVTKEDLIQPNFAVKDEVDAASITLNNTLVTSRCIPSSTTLTNISMCPPMSEETATTKAYVTGTSTCEHVETSAKSEITTKDNIPYKVVFSLKGKLKHRHDVSRIPIIQLLHLPVDCEERLFTDIIHNYPIYNVKANSEHKVANTRQMFPDSGKDACKETNATVDSTRTCQEESVENDTINNSVYKHAEPSLAEMRASAGVFETNTISDIQSRSVETNVDLDDPNQINDFNEQTDNQFCSIMKKLPSILYGNSMTSIRRYSDTVEGPITSTIDDLTHSAKKGGRSDPDNPFAITSPSFSESAAKALMTTINSSIGTIVKMSIMSIGSRKKLIPNIVSSEAAKGGIVSIVNPMGTDNDKASSVSETEVKSEKTSIMSKLKREQKDKQEMESEETDTDIDRLDIHIEINDNQFIQKRWVCKLCPKSYTTKHNLVAHILDHSGIKPHLCLVCGKYFKQLSHLNTHMLTHDNCKPHICPICDKGFTQISHLKRHETVHLQSKPYICELCNRGFAYPSELRSHKEKHITEKEKCVECHVEFDTPQELQEHMAQDPHCSQLTCKYCDRMFKFPSQLRDHVQSHQGSRPYMCTECGMDFMKDHHLKAHQFTHTGLRPYKCPHCSRAFNQKANMVRHMLIHNPERAYECDVCNKTFTQPQTLKAHMVVHATEKPYSCTFCGKQFGRQHNLQGHLHIHGDSKPNVCSICQASFTLKGNLNRHKKIKHGLNESTENMEEDAVKFLSYLSTRNTPSEHEADADSESKDGTSSIYFSKSPKKGRKSTPRKHVVRKMDGEMGEGIDGEINDELREELTNMLSYSDEERENEERMKAKSLDSVENERSVRKRNLEASFHDKDSSYTSLNETEKDNKVIDKAVDNDNKTDIDMCTKREDTKNIEQYESTLLSQTNGQLRRPTRKRKKKGFDDEFTDREEVLEEEKPRFKSRRKKGAKLDTIIATKLKKV